MGLHQRAGHSVVCVTALLCLRIHTAGYCSRCRRSRSVGRSVIDPALAPAATPTSSSSDLSNAHGDDDGMGASASRQE